MSSLIYLATPYNHSSPFVREERFHTACSVASRLMREGVHLFCPIAHTHPIAHKGSLPHDWDYWRDYDRLMLSVCNQLWVVQMDGWDRSEGIKGEIEIALQLSKRVLYVDQTSLDRRIFPWT